MAYVSEVFKTNFLEYASYVIKDRAIPHIDDGLKPVQRRILHSLFELDDGKFNKVANVVGNCMKYHPHGDASIYSALVAFANKDLFIDKQGNFGNIFTGDAPSAARYIECRLLPLAKDVFYNPEITEYEDSYDGRNREPVTFPAKIPVLLVQGAEGIAVGMSTRILPHNLIEVVEAVISCLKGESFTLFPDFLTGGFADVSEYDDGNGKILVRAKLDTKDPKKIIIRELPFGSTTESLINSIETAAKKNKIKISTIDDYSAEGVEIEIKLARGVYTNDTADALFAFTDCESSIAVNLLVIKDSMPVIMTVSEVIQHHADRLMEILIAELKLEQKQLGDRLHARTIEQIFIEERIYKRIEEQTTKEGVLNAVTDGFRPFSKQIRREVTTEDVDRLLKIVIRRISLYDINKVKKEMQEIRKRIKAIKHHLTHITDYAISFLQENIISKHSDDYPRQTEIISFGQVDVREAAQRNLKLRYDPKTGYIGYEASGNVLFDASQYDRILVLRKTGAYSVMNVPEKLFVDKGMLYCGFADNETCAQTVFTIVYKNEKGYAHIKRCRIEKFILSKGYSIIPDNCTVLKATTLEDVCLTVNYKPKPRLRVLQETFRVSDYAIKGVKARGVRLASKEVKSVRFVTGVK
ncbi:MAG: DNA topoisomerase IV subunit A [Deltaproteobacteria bacterium]|uniref:DNA topoisomerase IV subunit A n=1 Tax=Candidatus Desulfacyla euxinica TaxID=2841693 RepID=A0A8J6N1S9_9DELT|nr:DNA topoisomerase IV subunit A [Candidatus Desulfacyla euxinica]